MKTIKRKNNYHRLLDDPAALRTHIAQALHANDRKHPVFKKNLMLDSAGASAVLFLLGMERSRKDAAPEPCLILNKRSSKVKQAGDLCCPGGGIAFPKDEQLAKLLLLPRSPLTKWSLWKKQEKEHRQINYTLALLLATSLRESYEEMQLNPFKMRFLGVLPVQQLATFGREIYPMAGWISHQKHFVLNWEVEKIVTIPLRELLDSDRYARTRFNMDAIPENTNHLNYDDRPCFIHQREDKPEILWGATFRMTMVFLEIIFGFSPPRIESLPLVHGMLDKNYLTGSRHPNATESD